MKFQLILLLLAYVIRASEIEEKSGHKESFLHGASTPIDTETNQKRSSFTRDRKNTKALEQEKRRQSKLEREALEQAIEEEKSKEKREENEAEARERLRNIVEYDEEKKTLSMNYFATPPEKNKFFCFLYNMCRKKKKTSLDFANVEFAKFSVSEDNPNEFVVVILSREKENFPGKFDEFIVDFGNVIKHNDIQNAFDERTFKHEAEQNKKQFVKGRHAFADLNHNYGRESQTKMWMMDQEKETKKLFSESAHAEKLHLNFKLQGIGGAFGAHYGAFRSREKYNLSQK